MKRVLFLSAPNDPRSLIAEALLQHIDPKNFEPVSATLSSQEINPVLIEIMSEIGVNFRKTVLPTLDELRGETFDFVITLDEATAKQPHAINAADTIHWKFDSPLTASSERETQRRAFQAIRDQIAQRLRLFAIVNTRGTPSPDSFAEAATAS